MENEDTVVMLKLWKNFNKTKFIFTNYLMRTMKLEETNERTEGCYD